VRLRWLVPSILAWVTVLLLPPLTSHAGIDTPAGSPRPVVHAAHWRGIPSAGEQAWLKVTAGDRDGAIFELTIDWGDHSVSSVLLVCQPEPGTPARALIPKVYSEPGHYAVRVTALSLTSCAGGYLQESPARRVPTRVAP
jgi:hypothetical protein